MDDRACCCSARPVVRVLMPATPSRPYRVELLLRGHYFRLSQWTLAAAGGVAQVLPGQRAAQGRSVMRAAVADELTVKGRRQGDEELPRRAFEEGYRFR